MRLTWTEVGGEIRSGSYQIRSRRNDAAFPWRLEQVAGSRGRPAVAASFLHHSLVAAQRHAVALEQQRSRTLRATVHGLTFVASLYIFVLLASTPLDGFTELTLALVALVAGLRSAGNAVAAKRPDIWGWRPEYRPGSAPSLFARSCDVAVTRTSAHLADGSPHPSRIRTIPPS